MVGLGRVELPTYGLGNRRSIHLSYSPISDGRYFTSFRKKDAEQIKSLDPAIVGDFIPDAKPNNRNPEIEVRNSAAE
jgi:hypothetical protein